MALQKIKIVSGSGVSVEGNDIDTDRIIPARFMKCVTFEGLGAYTFYDARLDQNGQEINHNFNKKEYQSASILISGSNFGCGSSREHAPQALYHWGIRSIIAESFAEIFFGNCINLGIPCINLSKPDLIVLSDLVQNNSQAQIQIDLSEKQIKVLNQVFSFEIPEQARLSLINGIWDSLGELLENKAQIQEIESKIKILSGSF